MLMLKYEPKLMSVFWDKPRASLERRYCLALFFHDLCIPCWKSESTV